MDWQSLNQEYLLMIVAAGSFVAGFIFARLARGSTKKQASSSGDRRDHLIRQLEADLRLANRRLEEYSVQLETTSKEVDQSMATVHDLSTLLDTRNGEVEALRKEVKGAVKKTHELRRELTDRAEETLREHVRAEEAKTELDVVRAGSDAIVSEFSRRQDESQTAASEPDQRDLLGDAVLFDEDDRSTDA